MVIFFHLCHVKSIFAFNRLRFAFESLLEFLIGARYILTNHSRSRILQDRALLANVDRAISFMSTILYSELSAFLLGFCLIYETTGSSIATLQLILEELR